MTITTEPNSVLILTNKIAEQYEYCFSIGRTRISGDKWECRMWPHGQEDRRKVIISISSSIEGAVEKAINELKQLPKQSQNFPRRS